MGGNEDDGEQSESHVRKVKVISGINHEKNEKYIGLKPFLVC